MPCGCLYIPEFPAWSFEKYHTGAMPQIVVCAGKVVSASPALRHMGIADGMPADRAGELAPEARRVLRDGPLEEAAWEDVLSTLNDLTPFIESASRGQAYFRPLSLDEVREIADALQAQIGIADSRGTAHLAAHRASVGQVLLVPTEQRDAFLQDCPIQLLVRLGFDSDFTGRLRLFGYKTLGEAVALKKRHLDSQFGKEGVALYELLHPKGERPISTYHPPPTLSERYDVEHPAAGSENLLAALKHLSLRLAEELGPLRCQRLKLAIAAEGYDGILFRCTVLPEATARPRTLFRAAERLLQELLHLSMRIQTLAVELGALSEPIPEQGTLFEQHPEVERAVEAVHQRYPNVIRRPAVNEHALFPEDRAALEPFG